MFPQYGLNQRRYQIFVRQVPKNASRFMVCIVQYELQPPYVFRVQHVGFYVDVVKPNEKELGRRFHIERMAILRSD
jgi:hypothetical protein